jgi:hypothetical protein
MDHNLQLQELQLFMPVVAVVLEMVGILLVVLVVAVLVVKTVVPQGSQELRIWVAEEAAVLIRASLAATAALV